MEVYIQYTRHIYVELYACVYVCKTCTNMRYLILAEAYFSCCTRAITTLTICCGIYTHATVMCNATVHTHCGAATLTVPLIVMRVVIADTSHYMHHFMLCFCLLVFHTVFISHIVWLHSLVKCWGMWDYARARYTPTSIALASFTLHCFKLSHYCVSIAQSV
jgi:hypothetical protein